MAAIARKWFPAGRLARNTLWVMSWQGARVAAQAVWLVLVARALGPQGYGAFAGIAGLGNTLGGLAGLGLGLVMYQEVAKQPSQFGKRWRQTLAATAASGSLFALVFVLFGGNVLGYSDLSVITGIALSELVCFPLVTAAAFAFAAHERMGWSAALPALLGGFRVLAVAAFFILEDTGTLAVYAWFHAGATALFAAVALLLVHVLLRPAAAPLRVSWRDLRDGVGFSAVWVTGNALTSVDKALVMRLAGNEVAGLYASAYRFATVLALPMDALAMAAMPRLFREGGGAVSNPHLIPRLLLVTLAYGLLAGGSLWLLADLLPLLLGEGFAGGTRAVRLMALFLPCYGLRVLAGNLLMARGRKTQRVLIEWAGLGSLVLFGVLWIPGHGLEGAVMMIIAAELMLAGAAWGVLLFAPRGQVSPRED